jgi:Beta-glucosidase-related glycosidases
MRFGRTLALVCTAALSVFAQEYQIDRYVPESSSSEKTMCVIVSSSSSLQMTPAVSSSSSENAVQSSSSFAQYSSAIAQLSNAAQYSSNAAQSSSAVVQSSSSVARSGKNPYGLPNALMPLWESMTLRQKAGQMIMVFLTTPQFVIDNEIGGLLLTGKHLREVKETIHKIDEINSSLKIPVFTATDQEGGIVSRISSLSDKWRNVPSARDMRNMDTAKIHLLASKIGRALKSIKINMNLAPVLDPSKDYSDKISFMEESHRSWGHDTTNAYKIRAFVKGMRENGIVCVSKHFPGYDSWTNSDHQIAISATPRENIQKYIQLFKTLSRDIPVTMMSSVQFLRISNRPAVFDKNIVKMARHYAPNMIMLTDDLWGTSLRAWASGKTQIPPRKNYPDKDFKRLITTVIDAGNDILMISFTSKAKDMLDIMMELSEKNSKYKHRIEESAARILKLKYKMGLLKK